MGRIYGRLKPLGKLPDGYEWKRHGNGMWEIVNKKEIKIDPLIPVIGRMKCRRRISMMSMMT